VLDCRGNHGSTLGLGRRFFSYSFASMLTLEHIQPSNQWVPAAVSPVAKQPVLGADHSHPSGADIKNDWG
jgi:hypothetical protein